MNEKNFEIENCKKEIKSTKFEANEASTISSEYKHWISN